jgi:hypothetical protein
VATTTQIAIPTRTTNPIDLWHLLSLDAATVAALWTWFIARACHIALPLSAPLAMALAVWILYATDRILDVRRIDDPSSELEARHFFHHRHRRTFLFGITIAAVTLAALLPDLSRAAIPLYLIEGASLVAWFIILHATRSAHRLPKEIAVGLFFSAAIFIPTVARDAALRLALFPLAILFAALCSLNCLFIYAWEHEGPLSARLPHPTTRLAVNHLRALAAIIATAGGALALWKATPIPGACALAALLLLSLHRNRRQLSRTTLRATADLALLTPLLLLPFLR